jgi:hypothetical protein
MLQLIFGTNRRNIDLRDRLYIVPVDSFACVFPISAAEWQETRCGNSLGGTHATKKVSFPLKNTVIAKIDILAFIISLRPALHHHWTVPCGYWPQK